jgi:hypothetical protein
MPSGAETQQSKRDSSVASLPRNDGMRSDIWAILNKESYELVRTTNSPL